jgi:hypothetical protein
MGETDDNDLTAPATPTKTTTTDPSDTQEHDKSKETDKLLKSDEKLVTKLEKAEEEKKEAIQKSFESLTNGLEITKAPDAVLDAVAPKLTAEEREVKPKKIPIGGIKMPGFFTRNKDKSNVGDGAENELLENAGNEEKTKEEEEETEKIKSPPKPSRFSNFLKNPFNKRQSTAPTDEEVPTVVSDNNGKPNLENGDKKKEEIKVEGKFNKMTIN